MSNSRAFGILIGVTILLLLLILKLFDIQILNYDESNFFAKQQQKRTEIIKAERGLLYDRNEILLTYNRYDTSIYLDRNIKDNRNKSEVAAKLASVFKKPASYYLNLINEKNTTVCIERKASFEKHSLIKSLKLNSLYIKPEPSRIYQYNNLASHIIGYVDQDYNGADGVEKYFNNILKGEDGIRVVDRSRRGRMITVDEDNTKPAIPGSNIQLTIDKKLQMILEEELRNGLMNSKASHASGIIMNPNTGEILALANVDDYDPNKYSLYDNAQRRNKCISDTYEPGSTFKGFVLAALLDEGLCNEQEVIDCEGGSILFKGFRIIDLHKFNKLTVQGIFEHSSNIGMHKLSQRISDEVLYKYLRGFGFGNFTSIELPAEAKGELKKLSKWTKLSRSSLSRGYEILVTHIQLATAFCALVNGGVLYQPQIVKKIIDPEGGVTFESSPKEIRKVISDSTSKRMIRLLESVVKNGTGKNAACDFVTVGGKTGTAKISTNGKYLNRYNSSFIGFYPVENPQVVCLISLNSPSLGGYGGLVAAPIFKSVTEKVLTAMNDLHRDGFKENQNSADIQVVKTKNISNKKSNSIEIKFSNQNSELISGSINTMPDLRNLPLREAITVLNKIGITYKISGSGRVISQSIEPGSKISSHDVCIIVGFDKNLTEN